MNGGTLLTISGADHQPSDNSRQQRWDVRYGRHHGDSWRSDFRFRPVDQSQHRHSRPDRSRTPTPARRSLAAGPCRWGMERWPKLPSVVTVARSPPTVEAPSRWIWPGRETFGSAVVDNGQVVLAGPNAYAVSSVITGVGGLTQTGSGVVTVSGSNSYSGTTALNAGELSLASAGAIGASGTISSTSGTISFSGGTLQYVSSSNLTDYSSRFNPANSQAYSIDVASGLQVTLCLWDEQFQRHA